MAKYKVTVPPTMEQGSYKTVVSDDCETKAAAALWDYNSARAHDGLEPIKRMPNGTEYIKEIKMITRKDYMSNSGELHHKYYSQFVTESTLDFIKRNIGIDKIKASKDKHLNDIVKISNTTGTWTWDFSPINLELARELGEVWPNSFPSQSTRTCVGKAAARMLVESL